jgi:PST family polysaccharide transporter
MRFGGVLTVVDIAAVVVNNMDYLFVGKVLGATSLGLYTIAFRLPELLILNLAIVLGDVLFPSYAAMDRSRLQDGFLLSLRYIAVLVLPMTVALVVLARPAVLTLFGEKFEDSVEVMRLLAVYAVLTAVSIPAGTIYKVTGRGGVLLYTSIPWVIVLFVGLVLFSRHGILAVALVLVGCVGVATVVNLAIASRMLGVSTRTVCAAVAPPVFAAAAMGAAMIPVVKLIGPPVAALVLGALVGVTVYVAVLWILARDLLTQLSGILRSGRASAA